MNEYKCLICGTSWIGNIHKCPEHPQKVFRTKKEILGAFASCIIRQYPYLDYQEKLFFPALGEVKKCVDSWEDQKNEVLGINDLKDFVRSIISACPAVKEYNKSEANRQGEHQPDYKFITRFSKEDAWTDFIDLIALEQNVVALLTN